MSTFPEYVQAQQGHKRKVRRGGRRSPKAPPASLHPAHVEAQGHLGKAMEAPSPHVATRHLFNALTALNKAKAGPAPEVPQV